MKAQQHWHKLDRDLAAKKAEHAAEVQNLKQEGDSWQSKWQEESKKVQAASEQLQRQEERIQALVSEKDKASRDAQDAVKVALMSYYAKEESEAEFFEFEGHSCSIN